MVEEQIHDNSDQGTATALEGSDDLVPTTMPTSGMTHHQLPLNECDNMLRLARDHC
jgi:hypothetical protein